MIFGKTDIEETTDLNEGETISIIEDAENVAIAELINHVDTIELKYLSEIENIEITITDLSNNLQSDDSIMIESIKEIPAIDNEALETITHLKTDILIEEFINENDEEAQTQSVLTNTTEIKERQTSAELGINLEELSTTVENEVQFTITLNTENYMKDLYKNPEFIIELPECVEAINNISVDSITLLNNTIINEEEIEEDIFKNIQIEQQESNNKKYIRVTAEGEQKSYTGSSINNVQIIIPAKITTSTILPTTDAVINLYYSSENHTTYNKDSQTISGYGEYNKNIRFVGATGILTKTTTSINGETIVNYSGQSNPIVIASNSNNNGTINIVAVNNTGVDLEEVKILGKSETFREIVVNDPATIKYSNSRNPEINDESWSSEYTEEAKSYLIEFGQVPQGGIIKYAYTLQIPEVQNDTNFEEKFEIWTANNEKIAEQICPIQVKTVNLEVTLESSAGDNNSVYAGQELNYTITVTNNGSTDVNEISIVDTLSDKLSLLNSSDPITWSNITLTPGQSIQKTISTKVNDNIELDTIIENSVAVNAKYLQESIIKRTSNTVKISLIDVKISSDISTDSIITDSIQIGSFLEYNIELENKTTETKNINFIGELPDIIDQDSLAGNVLIKDLETDFWLEDDTEVFANGEKVTASLVLNAGERKMINIYSLVDKYKYSEPKAKFTIKYDQEEIKLEHVNNAITPANISVEEKVYKNNEEVTVSNIELSIEDEIKYEIKIKNNGETSDKLEIFSNISNLLEVKSIAFYSENYEEVFDEEDLSNIFSLIEVEIGHNEEYTLIITGKLINDLNEEKELVSEFEVGGIYTNSIAKVLSKTIKPMDISTEEPNNPVDPDNPVDPENPHNPVDPENPDNPADPENPGESSDPDTHEEIKKYTISGVAWLDSNEDGERDVNEPLLSGITVKLINDNNTIKETKTNNNGEYAFYEIAQGEYIIVFEYDETKYKITDTKKDGILDSANSDVYEVNVDGENIIRTDKISLTNNKKNIDIGLIEREIFDLKVNKYISKITVNNDEGTSIVDYNNKDFAKLEIPAKYYVGSELIIEYNIVIENTGDVSGYVYELADIMPNGMKFISELNPDWYEENGKLYSVSLTQDKIEPQSTKIIKVVLVKEIENDKSVSIKNKAEIVNTFNDKLIQEKDLNNNISQAELLISIKTGNIRTYIILIITTLSIIGIGIYAIKKKVLV